MYLIRIVLFIITLFILTGCKTTGPLDAYQGLSDQQIFQSGEQNMKKHRYEQAVKDFEALDALYPFGNYSQQGQLDIITAYYKSDDSASALAAADRYIRLYPRASNVDYAYYLKGVINSGTEENWFFRWLHAEPSTLDVSSQKEAFQNFSTLVERFPNSQYSRDARFRMAQLRNLIAQHELEIAQYYLKRKTYVATINRATNVVENYQGAPQVVSALDIMVQSYRALNETDIADKAMNMLQTNYPDSQEAKKLNSQNNTKPRI